ncbi:MAG: fumarylacetoacetate hydrolase family protein [Mesorhizobium sp.]
MQIATYEAGGKVSYGVRQSGRIIDLPALFAAQGIADAPGDVLALIQAGEAGLAKVRKALDAAAGNAGDAGSVRLLPPIPKPPKVFCIGRNYAEHAKEAGFEMSPLPIMFHRFANTLIGSGADILYPKVSEQLDWEGELAVVIGKSHKGQIAREDAMDYVFGYTAFNDVTVRDYQFRTTQYIAGKNFRTSGPLGPVIVTKDELKDPHNLKLTTHVNDTLMQSDNTASMHFDVPFIINHLSEFIDLQAGDVIAMGTPAGVGFKRKPPIFLKVGDTVTVELEGVGKLVNTVVEDK